jgi:hypothetical protein
MSYIQEKVDGDLFYLKDKLSIIDVRQYNSNKKISIILNNIKLGKHDKARNIKL